MLLVPFVTGNYVASHTGCEPWCNAPHCTAGGSSCSSCTFCKGDQRVAHDEQGAATVAEAAEAAAAAMLMVPPETKPSAAKTKSKPKHAPSAEGAEKAPLTPHALQSRIYATSAFATPRS